MKYGLRHGVELAAAESASRGWGACPLSDFGMSDNSPRCSQQDRPHPDKPQVDNTTTCLPPLHTPSRVFNPIQLAAV